MSVNFNIAMLRSLQQPIGESLANLNAELAQWNVGLVATETMKSVEHARLVRGSLSMIGCHALAKLASTVEQAVVALQSPDHRGWDAARARAVAQATVALSEALMGQINHILSDDDDLPVRLWPQWRDVALAMGEPVPGPDDLFEPDPSFDDTPFAALAPDYLLGVVTSAVERLQSALEQLSKSDRSSTTAEALRAAEKVFDWAYGLRHGRGYQTYWLVLRARLALGLLEDPSVLEDKGPWNVLLREAKLELQKFGQNTIRPRSELLLKTLRPLLKGWPEGWTQAHPALAEVDARLGLSLFRKTAALVQSQDAQAATRQTAGLQERLGDTLAQVRTEWTRYVSGEGLVPSADVSAPLTRALALLSSQKQGFSDPGASSLVDALMGTVLPLPPPGQVPDELALEAACGLVLLEDAVERRGRLSTEFEAMARLQVRRLQAVRDQQPQDLTRLPIVRWESKKQERQSRAAMAAAFAEVRKDITIVEDALSDYFRNEDPAPLNVQALNDYALVAAAVLRLLQCPAAAGLATALSGQIKALPTHGPALEAQGPITLGLTGLTSFLSAREAGDENADHLLEAPHLAVVGRPVPPATRREPIDVPARPRPSLNDDWATAPAPAVSPAPTSALPSAPPAPVAPAPVVAPTPPVVPLSEQMLTEDGVLEQRRGQETEGFFLDEVGGLFAEIALQRSVLGQPGQHTDAEARRTLRRQFHTLKGSGRIAGFLAVAEAAFWVEERLNRGLIMEPGHSLALDEAVGVAVAEIERWLVLLRLDGKVQVQGQKVRDALAAAPVDADAPPRALPPVAPIRATVVDPAEGVLPPAAPALPTPEPALELALWDETAELSVGSASPWPATPDHAPQSADVTIDGAPSMDQETFELFSQDALRHRDVLAVVDEPIEALDVEPLHRAAHTLGSLGVSLQLPALGALGRALERRLEGGPNDNGPRVMAWTPLMAQAAQTLVAAVDAIVHERRLPSADEALVARLHEDMDQPQAAPIEATAGETWGFEDPAPAVETAEQIGDETDLAFLLEPSLQDAVEASPEALAPALEAPLVDQADAVWALEEVEVEPAPSLVEPSWNEPLSALELEQSPAALEEDLETEGTEAPAIEPSWSEASPPEPSRSEPSEPSEPEAEVLLDALPVPVRETMGSMRDAAAEDALWDALFDEFEAVSTALGRIGPLLIQLAARRGPP